MDSISSASSAGLGKIRVIDTAFSPVRLWTPISPHPPPTCEPLSRELVSLRKEGFVPRAWLAQTRVSEIPHPPGNKDVSWVWYPLCFFWGHGWSGGDTPLTPTWLPSCPHLHHSPHHHLSRLHPKLPGQTRPISFSHPGALFLSPKVHQTISKPRSGQQLYPARRKD